MASEDVKLDPAALEAAARAYNAQSSRSCCDWLAMLAAIRVYLRAAQPVASAAPAELPDDIRVPLHSLEADIEYLFGRVAMDGSCAPAMANSVLERLHLIEAALQQESPRAEAHAADIAGIVKDAVIETADRPPGRRGPYVFDEDELQAQAAALAHPLHQPAPEAKPVAWLVEQPLRDGGTYLYLPLLRSREEMQRYQERNPDVTLVALYRAAPAPEPQAPVPDGVTEAARDVLAERHRQVAGEGWTPAHDDEHWNGDLARAAACYAVAGGLFKVSSLQVPQQVWPYSWEWKPSTPRRNLVKAGALILAEIERLDRAALTAANKRSR